MLALTNNKRIYLANDAIDFRYQINALTNVVLDSIESNPYDPDVIYVFYNKQMDKIKCLFWDTNGFVLYYKKMESLKFKIKQFKKNKDISTTDLHLLLQGMSPEIKGVE